MFDVTMTFDNGPHPEVTAYVLDILRERNIKASFFVVGSQLEQPNARAVCSRARDEGHWIGNHTYTHSIPLGERLGEKIPHDEIGRLQDLIAPLVEGGPKLFRPFGHRGLLGPHLLSRAARDYLIAEKFSCVLWNALPRDWENRDEWDSVALGQCLALPWSVVVVHDIPLGNSIKRLPSFLDAVFERGGTFRQDFPESCVPIRDGVIVGPIENIVCN